MATKPNWFEVDKDGLREMHSNFPPERIVSELVQNAFDENSGECVVTIAETVFGPRNRKTTLLTVADDNPEGFKDLRHAFTLFASTSKRGDAEKRGRFNLGEKLVFAQSLEAKVETTKGTLTFDEKGRHETKTKREAGSVITAVFPRWTEAQVREVLDFLRRINPPANVRFIVNGETVPHRGHDFEVHPSLPTELLQDVEGVKILRRVSRKTTILFRKKWAKEAFLYEMGIPVVAIEGGWDADVGQKVPLSHDRTTVNLSYLKEIYAELLNALQGRPEVSELGSALVKVALESDRITPATAADTFTKMFGPQSVIQSGFSPDANQEAARANYTLVPSRAFGLDVNEKLRQGGVRTSHEVFGRAAMGTTGAKLAEDIKLVDIEPKHQNFLDYAHMLTRELFKDDPSYRPEDFTLKLGKIDRKVAGVNHNRTLIVFNVDSITAFENPVSRCTHLILHELAHGFGNEHDGVYDHATEALVNKTMALLATNPSLFRPFEPALFGAV